MLELTTDRLVIKANCESINGEIVFLGANKPISIFNLGNNKPENSSFAIYLKTGEFIGHISILSKRKPYELSIGIEDSYQKKGYMSEALPAVIDWIIKNCNVQCIFGLVGPITPDASRKILKRNGFKLLPEGQDEWWVLEVMPKS